MSAPGISDTTETLRGTVSSLMSRARQDLAALLRGVTRELIPDGRTTGEHAVVPARDS